MLNILYVVTNNSHETKNGKCNPNDIYSIQSIIYNLKGEPDF